MRRKIYKMICVAVACMSLIACDSWLDVDPSDQYSTETFWKTKEHASAGIMGCYNALKPRRSLHTLVFVHIVIKCGVYLPIHITDWDIKQPCHKRSGTHNIRI